MSSSGNIRDIGASEAGVAVHEVGVDDSEVGGSGGVADGWEDGQHRDQEGGRVSGIAFSDSVGADCSRIEEVEEESASDDDSGSDVGQSATKTTATATESSGGDEALSPTSHVKDPSMMRLSRRIARSGVASRREAERLIEGGVVTVNGLAVQTPALNVGPRDIVKVEVGTRCF